MIDEKPIDKNRFPMFTLRAAGYAMAPPPLLALLLLGLFTPHSLAGYCFTSVASPINGYWTWGQTVSTPTLLVPLPLDIGKNPRAPSALHGGAGPRSVTPDGRTSPRDSTFAGNPRGPSLVPAWLPVLGKSIPRGTYLCPMPRATTHSHNTQRRVQMPRVSHPLMSRFPRVALNAFSHSPLPSPTSYPNPVHRPQH